MRSWVMPRIARLAISRKAPRTKTESVVAGSWLPGRMTTGSPASARSRPARSIVAPSTMWLSNVSPASSTTSASRARAFARTARSPPVPSPPCWAAMRPSSTCRSELWTRRISGRSAMARPRRRLLGALKVDALGHRQVVEKAAQAIQPQLHGAEPHPVAPAEDARAARLHLVLGRDADADRAAEVDAVRPVVEIDQHGERMACRRLPPRRLRDGFGGLAVDLAMRFAVGAEGGQDRPEAAGDRAAAKDRSGPRKGASRPAMPPLVN